MNSRSTNPDAKITVRFLETQEGGRKSDVVASNYGCPLMVDGEAFDCRFLPFQEDVYHLGRTYEIPIKFLSPDLALSHLSVGVRITLWEGKTIAAGTILWLRDRSQVRHAVRTETATAL